MTAEGRQGESLRARWQYGRIVPMPEQQPAGWDFVKLTEVARLESGHTPSRKCPEYWAGSIPWVSLHDSKGLDRAEIHNTAQTIGELGLANSSARMLPAGTVVFSRTATVGKSTILGREMATSQDFANYVCGPRIHNRYLMQLLRYLQPEWNRLMAGSTHNTIYMPVFENLQVLLPSYGEQRKIAAILSTVDDAIEATQAVIDQLQVVKKAVMAELLTHGLPERHTRFKQTEIGDVPEEWEVLPFEAVLGEGDSLSYGILQPGADVENGVPMLRTVDLDEHGGRAETTILRVEPKIEAQYERTRLRGGEVLLSVMGTVGRTVVASKEWVGWNVNRALAVIRVNERATPEFLSFWLRAASTQERFEVEKIGSAQKRINLGDLRRMLIPVPTRDEQSRLCDVLSTIESRLHAEAAVLAASQAVKIALTSVLLTGEIRVKPDEVA